MFTDGIRQECVPPDVAFIEWESRFAILYSDSREMSFDRDRDDDCYNFTKMSRIEFLRLNGMACHMVQCSKAGVSDIAMLPDLQTYTQAMKQLDASKWTEAI